MSEWTEGVCGDGAVFIRDGEPQTISQVLDELNRIATLERAAWAALHRLEVVVRDDDPRGPLEFKATKDGGVLVRRKWTGEKN